MSQHDKISYVEFPAKDLAVARQFFAEVFGWQFEDFGPEYTAFSNAGLQGGFYQSDKTSTTANGATLVVLYSNNLLNTLAKVEEHGGSIVKPIFSFPGGRRFHFSDPNGNEYAVWSENR